MNFGPFSITGTDLLDFTLTRRHALAPPGRRHGDRRRRPHPLLRLRVHLGEPPCAAACWKGSDLPPLFRAGVVAALT